MFQDQGILRAAKPGETPASSHDLGLNVWPDPQHYYDTHGNEGMDGLVYSDRTPQTDYWQLRKVYSPVQVTAGKLDAVPGPNALPLHVENRFDFRSLEGLTLAWSLRRNGREVERGTCNLPDVKKGGALQVGTSFMIPRDPGAAVYSLAVECREGNGAPFYERCFRLHTGNRTPASALAGAGPSGSPELVETPDRFEVVLPGGKAVIERATGEIALQDRRGRLLARGLGPHAGRRLTEGEFVRRQREATWPRAPWKTTLSEVTARRLDGEVLVRVGGHHARSDAPEQGLTGSCELRFKTNGAIEITYDYQTSGHGLLLEAGFEMTVPAGASEFRWIGAGPYAGYPGKDALNEFGLHHLGRDDLYFQGNRRQVELALLTTPQGSGIALGGTGMDVAVEREGDATVLSHNAVISGRGNKFVGPDQMIKAEDRPRIAGKITVFMIPDQWPTVLREWFGNPSAAVPFRPYFHSYDQ
jgi:beta-galactosidase